MKFEILKKGWSLLEAGEKRHALFLLCVIILSAITSALMVGSVVPFLSVLAEPEQIRENGVFSQVFVAGGFKSDYAFLVAMGAGSLAVIIIANLTQMLRIYLVVSFAQMRMYALSTRLLKVYLRQPYEFFLDQNSGEMSSQILAEAQKVVQTFYHPVAEAIASGMTFIAIVAFLIWINPTVTMVALVVAGGLYIGSYAISRRAIARFGADRVKANRDRFRFASEALNGVKDVKLLGRENHYVKAYASTSIRVAEAEAKSNIFAQLPYYVLQIVAFGGMIVLVLTLLSPSELNNSSKLGQLLPLLGVFALAGQRLIPEMAKLYQGVTLLNYGAPIVEAIHKDLQAEYTLRPLSIADVPAMGLTKSLELRKVSFSYPNSEKLGLNEVSFTIAVGERIGIVGGSGAGKTTLADVIMGLLRPKDGDILVDGNPIHQDNIASWQRTVGYVQQDIFFSDTSILENIALGIAKDDVDQKRAIEAARLAQLDQFVSESLPQGYDTVIGESGVRLSGGQRQRIGIARALYNDADLIVFDEATSALDNVTEKQVMESIDALPENKTVIIIAHRLSTLKQCDRLIVMDHGRIVGEGSWTQLQAENPFFQTLTATDSV